MGEFLSIFEEQEREEVLSCTGKVCWGSLTMTVRDRGIQVFLPSGRLRFIPMPPICTEPVEIPHPVIDYNVFELCNCDADIDEKLRVCPWEIKADGERCSLCFKALGWSNSDTWDCCRSGPHQDFRFTTMVEDIPWEINLKTGKLRKLRLPTEEELLDPEYGDQSDRGVQRDQEENAN